MLQQVTNNEAKASDPTHNSPISAATAASSARHVSLLEGAIVLGFWVRGEVRLGGGEGVKPKENVGGCK